MRAREAVEAMVNKETEAWNERDAEKLVSVFHLDMVWPWPPDNQSHDPETWVFMQGRFDHDRWRNGWQEIFDNYDLIHNNRRLIKIEISEQQDGGIAVVDVNTLWRNKETGEDFHWKGRACKGYTLTTNGWKLIFHTGLLEY